MAEVEELSWDLTVFFENFDDPQITETIERVTEGLRRIEQDFKGKIDSPETTPPKVLEFFKRAETLLIDLYEIFIYAHLSFDADQSNKEAAALSNKADWLATLYEKQIAFFELEMGELLEVRGDKFLNAPVLSEFQHYLKKILEKRPFRLSEQEEKLILEKDLTGINEWQSLQKRWVATRSFMLAVDGEEKEISWSSGQGLFYHSHWEVRKEAYEKLLGGLGKDADLFATALRNISANYVNDCRRRKYSNPMEPSLITNDITQEILDSMINVVESNVNIFQEFLLLKAKLLGTEKLRGEDLLAPLPEVEDRRIAWTEAKEMIIDCYSEFDDEFGSIARRMFEKKQIDAAPRSSKVAGAFCGDWYKGKSAFILQSFNERINDVQTLVHELGHATHSHLAAEKQSAWNRDNLQPLSLAETASEFSSMLFTDKILRDAPSDKIKREILFSALQRMLLTVFEVSSRIPFEQSLYNAIEQDEFLEPEKINELFWEARNRYFGNVIDWLPEQVYQWCSKPHYYDSDRRFYNYPYVFGELLVLALYKKYREEGTSFIPKYKAFLAAGGSKSPQELAQTLGVDLTKRKFWEEGIKEIERLLTEFKELLD